MASVGLGEDAFTGMRHNDDRLHEILNLAKACLKTGRCPGDFRQKDFFERFDAQAQEAMEVKKANMPQPEPVAPPTPPPICQTPEGCSPEARDLKMRRDLRDLAHAAAEKKQELDAAEKEYNKELLLRCRAADELRDAKAEHLKTQRAFAEMKEMIRRQDKEIAKLKIEIDIEGRKATAAIRAAESKIEAQQRQKELQRQQQQQRHLQIPVRLQWEQTRFPSAQPSLQLVAGASSSPMARSQDCEPFADEFKRESTQEVSVEELQNALIDKLPPGEEPKCWMFPTPPGPWSPPDVAYSAHYSASGGGTLEASAWLPPASKAPNGLAAILGLAEPPKSRPAYASVLAKRPKQHKLYMP